MVDFTGTPANDDKSLKYDDDREIVLKVNPEYERLVPKPTPEEYTALRESIQRDGQRDDIIVNEDLIVLDGHQRNRACLELGIKTKFKIGRFPNKLEEERFVIESNVLRRHLNLFQKAEAGLALLEIERQLARKRQGERSGGRKSSRSGDVSASNTGVQSALSASIDADYGSGDMQGWGKATELVARRVGLHCSTFERALAIMRHVSDEETLAALRLGKLSIYAAYTRLRSKRKSGSKSVEKEVGHADSVLLQEGEQNNLNKIISDVLAPGSDSPKQIYKARLKEFAVRLESARFEGMNKPARIPDFVRMILPDVEIHLWKKINLLASDEKDLDRIILEAQGGLCYFDVQRISLIKKEKPIDFQEWVIGNLRRWLESQINWGSLSSVRPGVAYGKCPSCKNKLVYRSDRTLFCPICREEWCYYCPICAAEMAFEAPRLLNCKKCAYKRIFKTEILKEIKVEYALHLWKRGIDDPRLKDGTLVFVETNAAGFKEYTMLDSQKFRRPMKSLQ